MSGPPMPLPPDGDVNRAPTLIGVTWFECVLSTLFVALRFYCRIKITRNVWWDDWVILLTLALTYVFSSMYTVYAHLGGARHVAYLDPQQIAIVAEYNYISLAPIVVAIAIGKCAVALLIYRLQSPSKWRTWLLWFLSISSLVLALLVCIIEYVQCTPTKALWNPSAGTCWDPKPVNNFDVAASAYWAAVDFALAVLPATFIWKLRLTLRKRVALCCILGLGVFAAICGAVKASLLHTLTAKSDLTWRTTEFLIWNANEVNIIIYCACLPTLQPLFRDFFNKVSSITNHTIPSFSNTRYRRSGYKSNGAPFHMNAMKVEHRDSDSNNSNNAIIHPAKIHANERDDIRYPREQQRPKNSRGRGDGWLS